MARDRTTWTSAQGSDHPLARLEGRPLAGGTLAVLLGPKNPFGARYFQLVLEGTSGASAQPLVLGLHSAGRYPSYNWIEVIHIEDRVSLPGREGTLAEGDLESLLGYLADVIPPGGHLMVEYESELWRDTRLSLVCGIPPVATPLGGILFRVGCGVAFKDWHFSEGGSEGPRKLQGYKALREEHRRERAAQMKQDLETFLAAEPKSACGDVWEAARERARWDLSSLATAPTAR